jgi:succinoglycan biosynthesis transport protein ExoP
MHYDKLLEKMLDSMASEADDMRLSNAKIISPASVQLTKVGKMQGVYVAFSVLLGVTLGVGFGFLLENMDQSVRTAADVEEDLGVPLLGSVPDIRNLPEFTRRIDRTFGHKSQ